MMTTKTLALTLATLLAMPLAASAQAPSAQAPTSRPAGERSGMPHPNMGGGGTGERRWGDRDRFDNVDRPMGERGFRRQARQVTEEQWEEIRKFMAEHSPRRTAELENMGSESNKELLKRLITARYDFLMNTRREDAGMFELQLEKMKAEDAIFGILQDTKRSGPSDEDKKVLREHVTTLIEANFKEREFRIAKAKRSLTEAESRLDEDRKDKDDMIAERLNQYLREGARPLKMDRPEREGGGIYTRPNAPAAPQE